MKIRNGFVSNSSSSSFIIYGEKINSNIKFDKKYEYYAVGRNLGDGEDVFLIDDFVMLHALKLSKYPFDYYKSFKTEYDPDIPEILGIEEDEWWDMEEDEINYRLMKMEKNIALYINQDYNSCNDIDDIIKQYDLNKTPKEIEKSAINYYREKKLKRILK